ncbi:MAG TPA: TonB-dependent siderophore receptor, partial [Cellvibrio sp.]|nr:TonB-dependent siderophore receptor [Cellvibrio sp.]
EDTAIYEQVEVVKGATGLITGLANPSATINYLRKRPTEETRAAVAGTLGSWNLYRLDGHSINDSHSDANSSGALPLFYSDKSLTNYDVSTNTAPDWAYQNVE